MDLFFVITGFLFAPHLLQRAHMSVGAFAIRRAFRLYPLYVVSLLAGAATIWGDRPGLGVQLAKHLAYAQALPVFALSDAGFFSLAYWTLPVEVMFYALVCVALWCHRAHSRAFMAQPGVRLAWMGLLALAAYALSTSLAGPPGSGDWVHWQAQLPALLPQFWIGMALFMVQPRFASRRSLAWGALVSGLALLSALLAVYPSLAHDLRAPRPFGLFNIASALAYALVMGGCMALAALRERPAGRCWARAGLVAGSLSYGIYLFHDIALGWVMSLAPKLAPSAQVALAVVVTLSVAWLLHRAVEEPMRALGRRMSTVRQQEGTALSTRV